LKKDVGSKVASHLHDTYVVLGGTPSELAVPKAFGAALPPVSGMKFLVGAADIGADHWERNVEGVGNIVA
jgi:hypothetical protein